MSPCTEAAVPVLVNFPPFGRKTIFCFVPLKENLDLQMNSLVYPWDYATWRGGHQHTIQIIINLAEEPLLLAEQLKLKDAEVSPEHSTAFEDLCKEFTDVFSQDSSDLGKMLLMRMEIPTGDNPPISQRPYGLALKHVQWVKDEIETLEKAGVITKSVSPLASPIVIVPKKPSPGEPPHRRMCVDYRMSNSLLQKMEKAHTKAKGVLTLVPIPKIHTICQIRRLHGILDI